MTTASTPRNCFCIPRSVFTVLLAGALPSTPPLLRLISHTRTRCRLLGGRL